MNHSILVVDDDAIYSRVLCYQLNKHHFDCQSAGTGGEALRLLATKPLPDAILLDYSFGPRNKNGLELCRHIKSQYHVPLIMLTGNDKVQTVVSCLDAGADQYVVKPYILEELLARLRAAIRMYSDHKVPVQELPSGNAEVVRVDVLEQTLEIEEDRIKLTDKEFALAETLIANMDFPVSRHHLSSVIYEREFDPSNRSLDVLVGRLKRKLLPVTDKLAIKPVRGKGYMIYRRKAKDVKGN